MPKLTDTQLIVLSNAAAREDGAAVIPDRMNKAAAAKVGASFVAHKLTREIRSKPDQPVWREDEQGRRMSLIITRAGRAAIAVDDEEAEPERPVASKTGGKANPDGTNPSGSDTPRAGSKQALLIEMLSCNEGSTLDRLIEATGWLAHTTRAALTGLRKRGFAIQRSRQEGESSVYRIVSGKA